MQAMHTHARTTGGQNGRRSRQFQRDDSRSKRLLKLGLVIAGGALILGACGGGEDVLDAASEAVEAAVSEEVDDSSAGETADSSTTGTRERPTEIQFGETYEIDAAENGAPMTLTVPAGSVTVLSIEADAANLSSASLSSPTGFAAIVEPGGSLVTDPLITAAGEEIELVLNLNSAAGDVVTFAFDNALQTELPDGGDAPALITDAPLIEGPVNGVLGGTDIEDVHRFAAAPGDVLMLNFETAADAIGDLSYSWEFNGEVKERGAAAPGASVSVPVVLNSEQGGDWHLRISGNGAYTFTVDSESQNEAGSGTDAGPDIATAVVASPGTINGLFGGDDSSDFYAVELPAGAVVELGLATAADGGGGVNARLLENGSEVGRVGAQPGGSEEIVIVLAGDAGTGHIEVWGSDSNYEITLAVSEQNEAPGGGDAGDSAASAAALELPATVSGAMSGLDTTDFYSFTATAPTTTLTVTADTATSRFIFRALVDSDETSRATAGPGDVGTIEIPAVAGDVVVIELWNGRGAYEMVIE